jgi:hypothetical protein
VTQVMRQRMAAHIEGDFVVFLIGMRINKVLRPDLWVPVVAAMPRIIRELTSSEASGLLGFRNARDGLRNLSVIQYWRSFDHLHRYARDGGSEHFAAWLEYNRETAASGAVGIWHETYLVRAGEYEGFYNNMPAYGLGKAAELVEAQGSRRTAAGRLGRTDGEDVIDQD